MTPDRKHRLSLGSTSDPWNTSTTSSSNGHPPGTSTPSFTGYANFLTGEAEAYSSDSFGNANGLETRDGIDSQGLPLYLGASSFSRSLKRITVEQQSHLAGSLLTRHTVYIITVDNHHTDQGGRNDIGNGTQSVTRRYSDWVWLNEYLSKKYPARTLLTIPPKIVGSKSHSYYLLYL